MKEYISVKNLNDTIKSTLVSNPDLGETFSVRGELSGCGYRGSNFFFKLFDKPEGNLSNVDKSKLPTVSCNVWNYASLGVSKDFQDGQSVVVKGKIDVWTNKGEYRINVSSVKLDGEGLRKLQLERLRAKLDAEGFFDPENKKPIPRFPKRVGIVTARVGKAINDIIHTAHAKNPYLKFVFQPVQVEGYGAVESVVRGIQTLDSMGLDVIIVGRGGGAKDSLWTFDEEAVLRAIFEANTPIISAVGHEDDYLLSDEVADARAKTPTYAGDMVAVDIFDIFRRLDDTKALYHKQISNKLNTLKLMVNNAFSRLEGLSPRMKLENQSKQLELYANRLTNSMDAKYNRYCNMLDNYQVRLKASSPLSLLARSKQSLEVLSQNLNRGMMTKYEKTQDQLEYLVARLNGLSPTAKLVNGFGYISKDGQSLTSAKLVSKGDKLNITVSDGVLDTIVESVQIKSFKDRGDIPDGK